MDTRKICSDGVWSYRLGTHTEKAKEKRYVSEHRTYIPKEPVVYYLYMFWNDVL